MSKKLTFEQAAESAKACGYELVKYAGSSNAYGSVFRCQCGHTWSAKHNNVVSSNKTGCPECAKKGAKMNEAEMAKALSDNGYELVSINSKLQGQRTLVTTRCQKGHSRTAKLGTIIYAKKPCPECSKEQRGVNLEGFNERLKPLGYSIVEWAGTTRKKGLIGCKCGTTWEARINSVLQEQSHCPACFDGGLRGDKPAVFYIYELRKGRRLRYGYGISGSFNRRDVEHRRNADAAGWRIRLTHLYEFDLGVTAVKVEKSVKAKVPCPPAMFSGFKTEAAMPKDLPLVLAELQNYLI